MSFLKGINFEALKEKVNTGVKAAQEGIATIDVDEVVRGAKDALNTNVKAAQEAIANFDVDEAIQGAHGALAEGAAAVGSAIDGALHKDVDDEKGSSAKDLVSLLWCLAYVDGDISDDEQEMLRRLSQRFDDEYETYAPEFEGAYLARLQETAKEFGPQSAAKIEAMKVVESADLGSKDAKALCWNLLALANCEGADDAEMDLIRFIGEKSGLEGAEFEELRNYSDAILEISESIAVLRNSERSFAEIDPIVQEFTKRQETIIAAVESLISDR